MFAGGIQTRVLYFAGPSCFANGTMESKPAKPCTTCSQRTLCSSRPSQKSGVFHCEWGLPSTLCKPKLGQIIGKRLWLRVNICDLLVSSPAGDLVGDQKGGERILPGYWIHCFSRGQPGDMSDMSQLMLFVCIFFSCFFGQFWVHQNVETKPKLCLPCNFKGAPKKTWPNLHSNCEPSVQLPPGQVEFLPSCGDEVLVQFGHDLSLCREMGNRQN